MNHPQINIGGRVVARGELVYIIAEMSANHNQDFEQAVKIVHAAKKAGADALKLQTYTPDTLTIDCDSDYFKVKGTPWHGKTLYELYNQAHTPWEWHPRLKKICRGLGMDFFSTAFDETSVDFLEKMGVCVHKSSSFEIVDTGLIQKMAGTKKPLILSTGMSTLKEIKDAVTCARKAGASQIALLKCTSAYPAKAQNMNLAAIPFMEQTFDAPIGLSDHSLGIAAPVAAVALGACIIEKHFTLSKDMPGPDSEFSLTPDEFAAMVRAVREAEKSVGRVRFGPKSDEISSRVFRRSLFVVQDILAGEKLNKSNVRSIRPGYGMAPKFLPEILGRRAIRDIKRGEPLIWDRISGCKGRKS